MSEFVGLRAKLYAYKYSGAEVKKCKGVGRATVKNNIHFADYRQCLMDNTKQRASVLATRSARHEVFTIAQQKVALSCFDDKRYMIDNIGSVPHGHYLTN